MPPEVPLCYPLLTPRVQFSPPISPETDKYCRSTRRMKFPGKKLIPLIVFVLSSISVLRLIRILVTTTTPPLQSLPHTLKQTCPSPSPACSKVQLAPSNSKDQQRTIANSLTEKEFKFLTYLIAQKAPCNLLIFGLEPQYVTLASINAGGNTIFLEDDTDRINTIRINSNTTRIYKVEYQATAKDAYKLLKHTRKNPACAPNLGRIQNSTCQLALTNLPQEVYELKWNVVLVDGPRGNTLEAPGRMSTIYTARMIARAGNTTEVVVHDIDRMIEKWFSWEFLCEENLVSSKGRFWNFSIKPQSNSSKFCSAETVLVA